MAPNPDRPNYILPGLDYNILSYNEINQVLDYNKLMNTT